MLYSADGKRIAPSIGFVRQWSPVKPERFQASAIAGERIYPDEDAYETCSQTPSPSCKVEKT